MNLDPKTLFFSTMFMMLANGGILGLIRSDLPASLRPSASSWWVGTMMLALGTVLFALPWVVESPWGLTLANGLIMCGPMYYVRALRQFYGLPAKRGLFVPVLLGALGIYVFLVVWPHVSVRIVLVTLLWWTASLSAALVLHRQRGADTSQSRKVLLWIFIFIALISTLRVLYYLMAGLPAGWRSSDGSSITNLLTPLLGGVLPIIGTTAYLLLCSERLRRQWERAASIDYLTGLPNRLTLARAGMRRFADAGRASSPFAVALLDVDHFKSINDRYGHEVGDEALQHVAARLQEVCRANELPARQGGEEFAVVLEHQDAAGAVAAAERLRTGIERSVFRVGAYEVHITVSIGVAVLEPSDRSFEALLRRADVALYQAKTHGRNCVVLAQEPAPERAPMPV
jgi:diguanylate cyclase (GGDEF)-like protein